MSTEFVAIISSLFTAVIGPIAVSVVKSKLEKKNKSSLEEALEHNTLVDNKISEIREHYKADRVWIMQFHNGGHFYPTGKSIQKFSMFYENIEQKVDSIQQYFQNIPVSLFSQSTNQLLKEDIIAVPDFSLKDPTKDCSFFGLRSVAETYNCKSAYLFAIKTIDGKFIGTLGIEYTKRKHSLTDDEIHNILVEATSIGGVLLKV